MPLRASPPCQFPNTRLLAQPTILVSTKKQTIGMYTYCCECEGQSTNLPLACDRVCIDPGRLKMNGESVKDEWA